MQVHVVSLGQAHLFRRLTALLCDLAQHQFRVQCRHQLSGRLLELTELFLELSEIRVQWLYFALFCHIECLDCVDQLSQFCGDLLKIDDVVSIRLV